MKKYDGFCIHLASLHTKNSCGIGEFLDLIPCLDFAKELGFTIIQLLPLSDSGHDPSPYNGVSALANHPIYISLHALPGIDPKWEQLTALSKKKTVQFQTVYEQKLNILSEYVEQHKDTILHDPAFTAFTRENPWLFSYALFKVLKHKDHEKAWWDWDEACRTYNEQVMKQEEASIQFYIILQFLAYQQLIEVKAHADSLGIALKGDIPILLSPDSADVWARNEIFDTSLCAGAPPDQFSTLWQGWGFPVYNWEKLKETNYNFWTERLSYASHFFSHYRIDHAVGFFRVWTYPKDEHPRYGTYLPPLILDSVTQAKEILSVMLKAAPMTPIAEDLGVVPLIVKKTLKELGIAGTKVVRWQRKSEETFIHPSELPELSFVTLSTHDTPLNKEWWLEDDDAKKFARWIGWKHDGTYPLDLHKKFLALTHEAPSQYRINMLQEYLQLDPELVDDNIKLERINRPGTLEGNWCYRTKEPLETIRESHKLKTEVHNLLKGRCN